MNEVLDTSDFFNIEHINHVCPTFWGTEADGVIVKDEVLKTIHPTLKDNWHKLECLCGFTPSLTLRKSVFANRVYLTCGSVFKSRKACNYLHLISKPYATSVVEEVQKAKQELNKRSSNNRSTSNNMSEEEELVAPLNATNPFALSARQQQRERNLFKTATFNPWGNPIPDEDAPYLAITEDGYAITQDGRYEPYKGPRKTPVASPRFKQLYKYHKRDVFARSTPVTKQWLEGRYGQFLLPLESLRRKQLLTYHNSIKRGFEKMFSIETMEKKDGHRVKTTQTHPFGQLVAFYRKQKWQVDMPVTEEWLEKTYRKLVPKEEFALTDRYTSLLACQEELKVFEEWLERTYGVLVPRSLAGRRLYHLIECFNQNKNLSLTDTTLERTYGPLVPHDDSTTMAKKPMSDEFVMQEQGPSAAKKRKKVTLDFLVVKQKKKQKSLTCKSVLVV